MLVVTHVGVSRARRVPLLAAQDLYRVRPVLAAQRNHEHAPIRPNVEGVREPSWPSAQNHHAGHQRSAARELRGGRGRLPRLEDRCTTYPAIRTTRLSRPTTSIGQRPTCISGGRSGWPTASANSTIA